MKKIPFPSSVYIVHMFLTYFLTSHLSHLTLLIYVDIFPFFTCSLFTGRTACYYGISTILWVLTVFSPFLAVTFKAIISLLLLILAQNPSSSALFLYCMHV